MNRFKVFFLLVLVSGIGVLHFVTPGHMMFFHNTFSKLSYFPIVMGALWFGVRGGVLFAGLTSLGFVPHLLIFRGFGIESYFSEMTEILLYFAIGVIVGLISGRERRLKEKYQDLSEQLERSYERLHQETKLLIDVEEQLRHSQKLSALGELSASLAHEIKNPLGAIKGASEILSDEFSQGHAKYRFMNILKEEIARLDNIVSDMLSGFRKGPPSSAQSSEPLEDIIEHVLRLCTDRIKQGRVNIEKSLPDDCLQVMMDGQRLRQVLLNLLLNALDAVSKGGFVYITALKDGEALEIRVEDDGPGVPDLSGEEIFKPFFTSKESGTGLGLSICLKIMESLGGNLRLEKSAYGGACFVVTVGTG